MSLGWDLEPGDACREVCPACNGGSSGEKSLSVRKTDTGAILFHCFRASCGYSGHQTGTTLSSQKVPMPPELKGYEPPLNGQCPVRAAPAWVHEYLASLGLPELDTNTAYYDINQLRLGFYIKRPNGEVRGYVLRAQPGVTPKTLAHRRRYKEYQEDPLIHWQLCNKTPDTRLVIVEDIPSAIRINRDANVDAVALNGSTPSDAAFLEIVRTKRPLVWALDADAFQQGIKLAQRARMYSDSMAILLKKDFKNMTSEEVRSCLNGHFYRALSAVAVPTTESGGTWTTPS